MSRKMMCHWKFRSKMIRPRIWRIESDGTITSMIVRSGIPLVKPGDEVEKGQILVSGNGPNHR